MASADQLRRNFQKLLAAGNLAQGYIFFGHESAGEKFAFAKELADYLENKKWGGGGRVPIDAWTVNARQDGGINLIRSASRFLWQKPATSSKRTLVIDGADHLTLPAQNAILKIAEEPPAHALIILSVKDPEILLPAVGSRFQKIFFSKTASEPDTKFAKDFIRASAAKRKVFLAELLEETKNAGGESGLENFVAGLIAELRRDKIKNWRAIKELLGRWALIGQWNVNKKLQLESAFANF